MALILPYRGPHPITQPFGAIGFEAEPAGSVWRSANGQPKVASFGRIGGWIYADHLHKGVDVALPFGTPLYAPQGGTVVAHAIYTHDAAGRPYLHPELELSLQIRPGSIYVLAHLSAFVGSVGAKVRQGDLIARSGSGGNSTGPHLHHELVIGPASLTWRTAYYGTRWNVSRMLAGGDLAGLAAIVPA